MRKRKKRRMRMMKVLLHLNYKFSLSCHSKSEEAFLLMPHHGNELYQNWGNLLSCNGQREL